MNFKFFSKKIQKFFHINKKRVFLTPYQIYCLWFFLAFSITLFLYSGST